MDGSPKHPGGGLAARATGLCVLLGLTYVPRTAARAADPESPPIVEVTTTPPADSTSSPPPLPLLDERTAYTIGRHTVKLGILAFEFGILDNLSIGTDPPAWALRSFTSVLVPNLHVKYEFLNRGPWAAAAHVATYYAHLSSGDSSGDLFDVPLSLFVSLHAEDHLFLHAEATYVYAHLSGAGDVSGAESHGAGAASGVQTALMAEFRLTRIFSITAMGRVQPYVSNVAFSASKTVDPFTTYQLDGQVVPRVRHPWQVVGGVAFLWDHFHLILGVGLRQLLRARPRHRRPQTDDRSRRFAGGAVLKRRRTGGPVVAALLLASAGCQSDLTIPEPPMAAETAQLAASYEMPTAMLDGTNIQQAFTDAQVRLDALQLGWVPGLVVDLLVRLKGRLNAAGLADRPPQVHRRGRADRRRPPGTARLQRLAGPGRSSRPERQRRAGGGRDHPGRQALAPFVGDGHQLLGVRRARRVGHRIDRIGESLARRHADLLPAGAAAHLDRRRQPAGRRARERWAWPAEPARLRSTSS